MLGWDIHDYAEVKREFKIKPRDNPVDYALFINKSPCLSTSTVGPGFCCNAR